VYGSSSGGGGSGGGGSSSNSVNLFYIHWMILLINWYSLFRFVSDFLQREQWQNDDGFYSATYYFHMYKFGY
jgi:hypothetical protein